MFLGRNLKAGSAPGTELWRGRPEYFSTGTAIIIILMVLAILGIEYLILRGQEELRGALIFPVALLLINVFIVYDLRRLRYFITNRSVLRERITVPRTRQEMPLNLISRVQAKSRRGKSSVTFTSITGSSITFRLLREDPEAVKKIAIDAKSRLVPSSSETKD